MVKKGRLTVRVNGEYSLIKLVFAIFAFTLVFSFVGIPATYERNIVKRASDTGKFLIWGLNWVALILVCFLAFQKNQKQSRTNLIFTLTSLVFAGTWCIITIVQVGVVGFLRNPVNPAVYFLAFGFLLGQEERFWNSVQQILMPFSVLFSCLLFIAYFRLLNQFGVCIIGHSDVIYYFVTLFWLVAVSCADNIMNGKKIGRTLYFFLFQLLIFSFIIGSRSWILQTVILSCSVYILAPSKHGIKAKLKKIMLLVLLGILVIIILSRLLPQYLVQLFAKLFNDSRSHQYREISQAINPIEWLWGKGILANYYDSHQRKHITSIDNQYVFIAFHYGIITLLPCVYIYLCSLKSAMIGKCRSSISAIILVMWLLALGGLSIFNVLYLDIKSLLLPMYAGRVYFLGHGGKRKIL